MGRRFISVFDILVHVFVPLIIDFRKLFLWMNARVSIRWRLSWSIAVLILIQLDLLCFHKLWVDIGNRIVIVIVIINVDFITIAVGVFCVLLLVHVGLWLTLLKVLLRKIFKVVLKGSQTVYCVHLLTY